MGMEGAYGWNEVAVEEGKSSLMLPDLIMKTVTIFRHTKLVLEAGPETKKSTKEESMDQGGHIYRSLCGF